MNVRITPHDAPRRTELYSGVEFVRSDGTDLLMLLDLATRHPRQVTIPLSDVHVIALDDDAGAIE